MALAGVDLHTLRSWAIALRQSLAAAGTPVDGVVLFGSHARFQATAESDVDFAILSRSFGIDRFREGTLVNLHAHRIDPSLEAVPVSLAEWFERESVSPLIHEIKKDGYFLI